MPATLRRWRLPILGGAIAVVVVLLMITAIRAATSYYFTLPQFRALGPAAIGRFVQVDGVVGRRISWNSGSQHLQFRVVAGAQTAAPAPGRSGAASSTTLTRDAAVAPATSAAAVPPLPVTFIGPQPDAFRPGIDVVVAGELGPDGRFTATQVLVKCPSTYTAAPAGAGNQWPTG